MTPDQIDPTRKSLDELVLELVEQGNTNAGDLGRLTRAVQLQTVASERQTRARHQNNLVAVVVALLLILVAIDNRVGIDALQAKMCPLISLLGPGVSNAAPSTERGRDMAAAAQDLAEAWECRTR